MYDILQYVDFIKYTCIYIFLHECYVYGSKVTTVMDIRLAISKAREGIIAYGLQEEGHIRLFGGFNYHVNKI